MNESRPKTTKSLQYYMRLWHRNLGYLAFGMVVVYALSGIVLIHRTDNFMKVDHSVEKTLEPGMTADQLGKALPIKHFEATEETAESISFVGGSYDKKTGTVSYTRKEWVFPLNKFAKLHKMACAQDRHVGWFTTIFGVVLFLLALTSLFMFKTATRQFRSNMVYTAIGVVITVVLLIVI